MEVVTGIYTGEDRDGEIRERKVVKAVNRLRTLSGTLTDADYRMGDFKKALNRQLRSRYRREQRRKNIDWKNYYHRERWKKYSGQFARCPVWAVDMKTIEWKHPIAVKFKNRTEVVDTYQFPSHLLTLSIINKEEMCGLMWFYEKDGHLV